MLRKNLKVLALALTFSAALFSGKAYASEPDPVQTQAETEIQDGLQKIDNKLFYYSSGKALTNALQNVKGKIYYFSADGSALTNVLQNVKGKLYFFSADGSAFTNTWKTISKTKYYFGADGSAYSEKSVKIGDYYYIFGKDGKLSTGKKKRLVKIKDDRYYVDKKGRAIPGWSMNGKKVFYAKESGKLVTNKKVSYIRLDKNGYASNKYQGMAKIYAMKFINKHTNENMTRKQKLKKCFKYILKYRHYIAHYVTDRKASTTNGWQYKAACDLLCNERMEGNCRNFASSIAAIAKELGYKPVIYSLSWHSVVRIGNRWYDNMYGGRFCAKKKRHYNNYRKKFVF